MDHSIITEELNFLNKMIIHDRIIYKSYDFSFYVTAPWTRPPRRLEDPSETESRRDLSFPIW